MSNYGTLLSMEDLDKLGITFGTSVGDAVKTVNGVPINRQYDQKVDSNKYVGWDQQTEWNPFLEKLFSKYTIQVIQQKTSEYLTGVDPKGRKIMPTDQVVEGALFGVFQQHRPNTGDIYGKYTVVNELKRDDYSYIVDKTISLLVMGIRTELEMVQNNEKLTIWTTLLGDFNEHGLRQHAPIKVRNKRPDPMLFHMRY